MTAQAPNWTTTQKLAFRFFLLFFVLYILINPNGVLEGINIFFGLYTGIVHTFIVWSAKHVLHLAKPITIFTNGSGDTTYDYLVILLIAILSVTGTLIWSILDQKRLNYNKLLYWLTVIVRYYIAITMVTYGCFKIIKLQFPAPSLGQLLQPLGNFSPMGLEWSYMGYSTGFNYVTGFAEIICGLLLFFRKTTTLGAIAGVVVIGNVMAVNYCFDVPVKLLSTMLVVMSLFLLVKDSKRLINFFLLNKDAPPALLEPPRFKFKWKNITLTVTKYLLIVYVVYSTLLGAIYAGASRGDDAPKVALFGIYNVQSFIRNNDSLPPLKTDTARWNRLIVNNYTNNAQIQLMDDSMKYYFFKADTIHHTIVINSYADTAHKFHFTYTKIKPDIMVMTGRWKQDSVSIRFKRFDEKQFRLLKRGFHWINEIPYNR